MRNNIKDDKFENPLWLKGALPVYREEEQNFILLYPDKYPNPHFFNKTATYIFKKCNGKNSPLQIINQLHNEFPNVNQSKLEEDVFQTLHYLKMMELIKWDANKLNKKGKSMDIKLTNENDYTEIEEFIKNFKKEHLIDLANRDKKLFYMGYPEIKSEYIDIKIRTRHLHFKEVFFISHDEKGINGVSSIVRTMNPKIWYIGIFLSKNLDECLYDKFLDYIIKLLKEKEVIRLKLKIAETHFSKLTRKYFKERNFIFEGKLLDEVSEGKAVEIYSKKL